MLVDSLVFGKENNLLLNLSRVSSRLILISLGLFSGFLTAQPCNCDYELTSNNRKTAFLDGSHMGVQSGDTICIRAGLYNYIRLTNIHGTEEEPVVIINCGGPVKVDLNGHNNHGFIINNSTHFIATGTGHNDFIYGFEIFRSPHDKVQTGLAVGVQVSDLELDHFYIHDVELGLHLINVPGCDPQTWQGNWVMKNVKVHDFLIRNTTKEGMYIGSSKYLSGHMRECEGEQKTIMPSFIENIYVFDNRIEHSGWDGLQVSMAHEKCYIFRNRITNFGLTNKGAQRGGIVIGGGSTGRVSENHIQIGKGDGIDVFGIGGIELVNNVIIGAENMGIFIGNRSIETNSNFKVLNNTIVSSGVDGIRYNNQFAKRSVIANNLIVEAGYRPISITRGKGLVIESNNLYVKNHEELDFINANSGNFALGKGSKAKDNGIDVITFGIVKDFRGGQRKVGKGTDIGAFEHNPNVNSNPFPLYVVQPLFLHEGGDTTFFIPDNIFVDYDHSTLDINVNLKDYKDLPGWITFDKREMVIDFKPNEKSIGRIDLQIEATDGLGGTGLIPFWIKVKKVYSSDFFSDLDQLEITDGEFIRVYPQVVSNFILIETDAYDWLDATVYLVDSANKLVASYAFDGGRKYIDCRDLTAGRYKMKIINGNSLIIKDIQKK